MNLHKNYKHTLRALRKWVARFNADGVEELFDRSSRPHHLRAVTPEPVVWRIIALACHDLRDLNPPEQVHRYECEAPGDLISRHQETRAV